MIPIIRKLLPILLLPLGVHAEGLLAIDNPASHGGGNKVYAGVEAFEGNDQVAMRQYGSDWAGSYTPRSGVNLGLAALRGEAGVQWSDYRLGALVRADALVQTNRDTSDLVRQYKTSAGYDIGRSYMLDYQIKGFEADGARLSKRFAATGMAGWQADWGVGLSYLRGKSLKLASVGGNVVTLNTKDFDATANQSVTDNSINTTDLASFNAPFGRQASASGAGYALDAGLVLQHAASGARLELAVADLMGEMDWRNVPRNVSHYTTATKYYDANGYLNLYPSQTRASSYQNVLQTLDPKWLISASYPVGGVELFGLASTTQGYWFPQIGAAYRMGEQWRVKADYDTYFGSVGLSLEHPLFALTLRMEGSDPATSRAYGLSLTLQIPL